MSKERSAAITIGGKEYELVLTTRATKEIAGGTVGWKTWATS